MSSAVNASMVSATRASSARCVRPAQHGGDEQQRADGRQYDERRALGIDAEDARLLFMRVAGHRGAPCPFGFAAALGVRFATCLFRFAAGLGVRFAGLAGLLVLGAVLVGLSALDAHADDEQCRGGGHQGGKQEP